MKLTLKILRLEYLEKKHDVPYLLIFKVDGVCISLAELKRNYSDLTITDMPRGHSWDEETSYSTIRYSNNVKLSFGFPEISPDCIRSIAFSTD